MGRAWVFSVLFLAAGCRMAPAGAPVPLDGTPTELAGLAGEWTGRYWSEDQTGHGTLRFDLAVGADTARGVVEMTFAPALALYGEAGAGHELARRPCTTIDIAVVRVRGDTIRGTLAPYWNPACDCRTVSVFEGRLAGRLITGSFDTRTESGVPLSAGRWEAERRP